MTILTPTPTLTPLIALMTWLNQQSHGMAIMVAVAYAVLAWLGWQDNFGKVPTQLLATWQRRGLNITVMVHGLLLLITLGLPILQPTPTLPVQPLDWRLNLGFAPALSWVAWVGIVLFIVESHWIEMGSLRSIAMVLPCLAMLASLLSTPVRVVLHPWTAVHVLLGIAAHGVALLACGHAILLLALNQVLKSPMGIFSNTSTTIIPRIIPTIIWQKLQYQLTQHCPPLVVLERLLIRQSIWVTFLLGATIILGGLSGILHFNHKTVFSISSWLVWLAVAYGYRHYAWRGWVLSRAVFLATGLLLLSYIGSQFVLHAILQRSI